ncbi:MAG: hypothetical protein ABI478_14055, partial [Propionivibrio sp.]
MARFLLVLGQGRVAGEIGQDVVRRVAGDGSERAAAVVSDADAAAARFRGLPVVEVGAGEAGRAQVVFLGGGAAGDRRTD